MRPTFPFRALLHSIALFLALFSTAPVAFGDTPSNNTTKIIPANSLYQLESEWKRDDGSALHLADLRGQTRVLTLFFSHCNNICPMITGQLKTVEREMPADLHKRVGFVLVTLDPAGDNAETLSDYRERMGYSVENWTLLRGSADDTRELANLLGVTYMLKQENGQIDHNGLIVVLDTEGRIVEKFAGITDRKAFLALLKKTARQRR